MALDTHNALCCIQIPDIQFTVSNCISWCLTNETKIKNNWLCHNHKCKTKEQEKQLEENIKPLEKKVQRTAEEKKKLED